MLVQDMMTSAGPEISAEDLALFEEQGYLVYKDLLSAVEIESVKDAMARLCLKAVSGVADGSFAARRSGGKSPLGGWNVRETDGSFHVNFEPSVESLDGLSEEELCGSYRKLANYLDKDPVFEALAEHPIMTRYLEQLLGPGYIHFQNMALSKPARFGIEKPWHQDNAYFDVTPLDGVVGVWIAIDDATVENGCMHVMPTPRSELAAFKHIHDKDCEIARDDLDLSRVRPIEVPAGGALFFLGMVPHQTPPNRSAKRRRALQLHYHCADAKHLPKDEFDCVFCTPDGRPASCAAAGE
jgi:phytanoyl-CoA hydroxylase